MFLCTISPTGASPSQIVDEAWHLHLTYTQDYWKVFCKTVLEKDIHHFPSKGGIDQNNYHADWYEQTLQMYEAVFDQQAPVDIWPLPVKRARETIIEPQVEERFFPAYYQYVWMLLLPLVFPLLFNKLHPFALNGPQYLFFYPLLLGAGFLFIYLAGNYRRKVVEEMIRKNFDDDTTIFQFTRYAFGWRRTLHAAILDLVDRKILIVQSQDKFRLNARNFENSAYEKNPVVHNLIKQYEDGSEVDYNTIWNAYNVEMTENNKLEQLFNRLKSWDPWIYIALLLPLLFGLFRILQAMSNGRPFTFLIIMIVIAGIAFYRMLVRNSHFEIAMRLLTQQYETLEIGPNFPRTAVNEFAFLGLGALAYAELDSTFRRREIGTNTSSGSSCSGGGGCGSSCGGGDGGGCGGCGGGD